jgi:LPS export ABC transporter protein LptC
MSAKLNTIFGAALIAFFILLPPACKEKAKSEPAEADQVLENFTAFESNSGKRLWDLNAVKAYVHESENTVLLKDFKVRFYKKDWEKLDIPNKTEKDIVDSILKAKSGNIDMTKNDFSTKGETTVTTFEGETLKCDDLYYLAKAKKIFTDSNFTLYRKDSTIKGIGLEATPDLAVVIVKHNRVVVEKKKQ